MKYAILYYLLIVSLPIVALAETFTAFVTEPAGTAFERTRFYVCVQYRSQQCGNCRNWGVARGETPNQSGATAVQVTFSTQIPIQQSQAPVCLRYGFTTMVDGNETDPASVSSTKVLSE